MPTFKDIFYWDEWEEFCDSEIYFNCEVLRDVGEDIKDGDEFEQIHFYKNTLELEFYKTQDDPNPILKKFILQ